MASKKKQKTTSEFSNQSTATTTPNVPEWLSSPAQRIAGNIGSLQDQGPSAFAPQTSALQRQAWAGAGNLQTPDYSESRGLLTGQAPIGTKDIGYDTVGSERVGTNDIDYDRIDYDRIGADQIKGESLLTNLEAYYNPFKDQITNPVLDDFDFKAGQTRAAQAAQAATGQAFRGSRYGVQEAETEGQLSRGRAATHGGLLKDMFSESTRLSGEDADRRQSASLANQLANLDASKSNQGADLTASQANQRTRLGADSQNQNARLTADTANQRAALDAAEANQRTRLGADSQNQNSRLEADKSNAINDINRAEALGQLTTAQANQQRANIELQGKLGNEQAEMEQMIRQYPIEFQQQMAGLLKGLDPRMFTGQTVSGTESGTGSGTQTQSQGLGAFFGDLLMAGAAGAGRAATGGAV